MWTLQENFLDMNYVPFVLIIDNNKKKYINIFDCSCTQENNRITWSNKGLATAVKTVGKCELFLTYRWHNNELERLVINIVNIKSRRSELSDARSDAIRLGIKIRNKNFAFGVRTASMGTRGINAFNTIFNYQIHWKEINDIIKLQEELELLQLDNLRIGFYSQKHWMTKLDPNVFIETEKPFYDDDYSTKLNYIIELINTQYQEININMKNYKNLFNAITTPKDNFAAWMVEIERALHREKDLNNKFSSKQNVNNNTNNDSDSDCF